MADYTAVIASGTGQLSGFYQRPASIVTTISGTEAPTADAAITYRMRGFDQHVSVNGYVFWSSEEVDADASEYTGSAGPVIDVVVWKIIGD